MLGCVCVPSYCQNNINASETSVTTTEMYKDVAELAKKKTPIYDGLMSELFQFASPRLSIILLSCSHLSNTVSSPIDFW